MMLAFCSTSVVAQSPPTKAAEMERTVRAQADSGFSGVVLVAMRDSIILNRAFGSSRLTRSSPFWIASITKGFTAAAVLELVEKKKLRLTDSLGALIPGIPFDKKRITIHHLLTHTAGLSGTYSAGGIRSRDSAIKAILALPLEHAPGDGYRYSDDNYELLAAIVELVSGQSWEQFVTQEILRPALLVHTGFACGGATAGKVRMGRANSGRSSCPKGETTDWGHRGANGMWSTADDMLRWSRILSRRNAAVSDEVREMLNAPHVRVRREGDVDVLYGYGVRVYTLNNKVTEVMHSGSGDEGHTSIVRLFPTGLTVIVLSNSGQHAGTTWSSYVARKIVSVIG
jgi:CubicO group peptidase (beta-lactamase class C family)